MSIFHLQFEQKLPINIEKAWEFISNPANLKKITPAYMNFEITSKHLPSSIYPGMIISYKVSPIPTIRMNWVTEITHVQENRYFVDEQRVGPYSIWHHEHHLEAMEGGVLMKDLISYRPPILPGLLNQLFIQKQIHKIFDYRKHAMEIIFG